MKKYIISSFISASLGLVLLAGNAFAAPGGQLVPGPILAANGCGENNGVGVAYDGTNVLFTCAGEAAIRKTDINGTNLGSLVTADGGGNPVSLDAIAWDKANGLIWGGDLDAGNALCRIWSVDPTTGTATFKFSFTDPTGQGRCAVTFFDGITVDPSDGTLWVSPDVHTEIYHYQTNGTQIAADTIDFQALTAGECPWAAGFGALGCYNSGLAMGLDGNLFAGTAEDGKIYQLDPNTPLSLGVFSTVTGRDEDLECGPLVGGSESILSRDYETGRIDILEAPDGTCVTTEITLDPPKATNEFSEDQDHTVTATVTANGQPLPGVLVDFEITAGPNAPQASDPGECVVDPNCNTDASGKTSWSYTSAALGTDTIVACYTTKAGTKRCATATKDWVDTIAPKVSCTETTNPHGQKTPPAGSTTLPGSRGGQNEDGFYLLTAVDNLDEALNVFVSGFGPFLTGDKVKVTESSGAVPESKKMGSQSGQADAIAAHLILNADPVVTVTDASGNQTKVVCLVPPPPK